MTLTVKSELNFGREEIYKIRGYFRRLIRLRSWKKHVIGGLYVIEITHTKNGFHFHFHILYQGEYYPFEKLRYDWKYITGDSYIIWISGVRDSQNSFDYLLDYVTKSETGNIPREVFAREMKGIKLVQFFGVWTKIKGIIKKSKCKICNASNWISQFDCGEFYTCYAGDLKRENTS